jgi:hypothetical protein
MCGRLLLSLLVPAALLLAGCTSEPDEALNDTLDETVPVEEVPFGHEPTPEPTPATPAPSVEPTPPAVTSPATPTPVAPEPTPVAPAPVAPPPSPTPPSPAPTAWPHEGSHVRYTATVVRNSYDGGYRQEDSAEATWTFTGGDWRGTCTVHTREFVSGRGEQESTGTRTYSASSPPHWPLFNTKSPPAEGQPVTVWYLDRCAIESMDAAFAGTDTEPTTRMGQSVQAATYVASEPAGTSENQGLRTEWSRASGLVVTWSHQRMGSVMTTTFQGELMDTDAPL